MRSGYGISYIHFNRLGGENLLGYNGPSIVNLTINQLPTQTSCTADQYRDCFRLTQQGCGRRVTHEPTDAALRTSR